MMDAEFTEGVQSYFVPYQCIIITPLLKEKVIKKRVEIIKITNKGRA